MAKDFENGIWRTVGGRRIFIRDGEDLSSAMKRSGKFKSKKDIDHQKRKVENEMSRNAYSNEEEYKEMKKDYDAFDKLSKEKDDQVMSQKEYDKLMRESGMYEKFAGEHVNYDDYIQATKDVGVAETNKSIRDEIEYQNSRKGSSKEFDREKFNKWSNENSDKNIKEYEKETGRDALHPNGDPTKDFSDYEKEKYNQSRDKNYQDYMSGKKDWEGYQKGIQEANQKQQGGQIDDSTREDVRQFLKESSWNKDLETDIDDYNNFNDYKKDVESELQLLAEEGSADDSDIDYVMGELNRIQSSSTPKNKKQQGVQKLKDKLSGSKEEDEVATVRSQMSELEEASGSKVKDAFQTDLFGNGKENRFILEDGTIVGHTLESFGEKTDDWYVGNRHFKNYDEVKDYLSGGSKKSSEPKTFFDGKRDIEEEARQIYAEDGSRATSDRNIEYLAKKYDIPKTQARLFMKDTMKKFDDDNRKANVANGYYKKAFQEYKKKHPNTKLNLNQFIDMSEGKK